MKVQKVVVNIKIEALDARMVPQMLHEVVNRLNRENSNGSLEKVNGDNATWTTELVLIAF